MFPVSVGMNRHKIQWVTDYSHVPYERREELTALNGSVHLARGVRIETRENGNSRF